jgi:2-dehydropantoate 2-reductase
MQEAGLRYETPGGETERHALAATDDPSIVASADAVVVLVKSGDTAMAMQATAPYVTTGLPILTLQNGIGNGEKIRATLGDGPRVLVGVTSQAATRLGPGWVRHAGEGPTLIGAIDDADSPLASDLAAAFSAAGLPAAAVPDIDLWIWRKVAVNAAINGLTALGGFLNGAIAANAELLDAAEIVAEEAASVARARGYELGGMRRAVLETASSTAGNRSSMLQDLGAGRRTEVDAIHGAILDAGAEAGIGTPATQVLAALIRARERANTETDMETERVGG